MHFASVLVFSSLAPSESTHSVSTSLGSWLAASLPGFQGPVDNPWHSHKSCEHSTGQGSLPFNVWHCTQLFYDVSHCKKGNDLIGKQRHKLPTFIPSLLYSRAFTAASASSCTLNMSPT